MEHINFLNPCDFLECLSEVMNRGTTSTMIYDSTGGIKTAWSDELETAQNLVFYRLDFERKKFDNFVNNRILNGWDEFVLVFVVDNNLKLTTSELTRAKNGGVYIKALQLKNAEGFEDYEGKLKITTAKTNYLYKGDKLKAS